MLLPRPASVVEDSSSSGKASTTAQRSILGGSSSGPAFKGTAASQSTTKGALSNNGASAFAVFQDDSNPNGDNTLATQDNWTDFGTNASRKRENVRPAVPWKGETIPVHKDTPEDALSRSRPLSLSSSMKFEVFRDDDAEIPATDLGTSLGTRDIGTGLSTAKSLRAPPEAEMLRSDPFRHYAKDMVNLAEIPELPFMQSTSSGIASDSKSSSSRTQSSTSKPSTSSSSKLKASSSTATHTTSNALLIPGEKRKERVASPLHEIYPEGANGPEYSFEEIRAAKRHLRKLKTGEFGSASLCGFNEAWQVEARTTYTSWRVDGLGQVILRDPHSGEALFQYLREEDEREQETKLNDRRKQNLAREQEEAKEAAKRKAEKIAEQERLSRERKIREEDERLRVEAERLAIQEAEEAARAEAERIELERRARELKEVEWAKRHREEEERLRREAEAEEIRRQVEREEKEEREAARLRELEKTRRIREEQARAEAEAEERRREQEDAEIARDLFDVEEEGSFSPQASAGYRPPSPTINTKAALAEVKAMFGKTMRFDGETQGEDDYDSSATEQSGSSENDFEQNEEHEEEEIENEIEMPFIPSQAETDGSFWSIAQSQSQQQQQVPFSQPFSQPFSTQQSMPFDSQSSSLGFPSASSESGEATEESDGESDLAASRRASHLGPSHHLQHSLSRSSSSSSSGVSTDQPLSSNAALHSQTPAFTPFTEGSRNDENDIPSQPKNRSAFKPMRTPLGVKAPSNLASAIKPAFAVFSEEEEVENNAEVDNAAGYGMGRRAAGNNRFANMMDIMTPITERTCEFGMQTATMTSTLGGDVQARMLIGDRSTAEDLFDQVIPEDLASSRGSNWDAGRKLEQIDEEGDYSSQLEADQGEIA